jgi:uncharacterized protein (DUF1810 family)
MDDPYDLGRFVRAQDDGESYATALRELRAGSKRSHWIWYVFPQIEGLGSSAMSRRYAIRSLQEARAYIAHPVLGPRLLEATGAALSSGEHDPRALFGSPDDMKVRSSLTLFAVADPGADVLRTALRVFHGGRMDPATLDRLGLPTDQKA